MALKALKDNFVGKAAATGLAGLLAVTPLTGATAQDQQSQKAEFTQAAAINVSLSNNASLEALRWSQRNPGVSVAVHLGTESQVTPQQIENILSSEIRGAGVQQIEFFYEQNDVPATGVVFAYGGGSDGPFHLGEARAAARQAASQYLFERDNPQLALRSDR